MKQRLAIYGATGSIGTNALDVAARHPERFEVFAVTAHRDADAMAAICVQHRPRFAVMVEETAANDLRQRLRASNAAVEVLSGAHALEQLAAHPEVDTVLAAIVGAAGLPSTLAAAGAGKRILLANKEAIVMAGEILLRTLEDSGGSLLPIDSEHSAVLQCLPPAGHAKAAPNTVEKVILTASGGPFRTRTREHLRAVTPAQAIAHPNWRMGKKISVDSATLANKGLELIEAKWLFDLKPEQLDVLVHPQSLVHALVQYRDGSSVAQMGLPDMRSAIACAMAWPDRIDAGVSRLDLAKAARLEFESPDLDTFRALALAMQCLHEGGTSSVIFNAANEVAVDAFLNQGIGFLNIAEAIEHALNTVPKASADNLPAVWEADAKARAAARSYCTAFHGLVTA